MKRILLLTTISLLGILAVQAQNVFNPNDPLVRYNANAAVGSSQKPNPDITGIQKWVADSMSSISNSYSTQSYKAYYLNINGVRLPFRLKYPRSYNDPDSAGKKYPVMLFFHGTGEAACNSNGGVYNNEKQLLHGGRLFRDHVDNNRFDGFLLYPQVVNFSNNCSGDWGVAPASPYYATLIRLVDSLAKYARADVDRLVLTGLSNGGGSVWSMLASYPQRVAGAFPSAAATGHTNFTDFVHVPVYFASGANDNNPTPAFSQSVYNSLNNLGADIKFILYPNAGHSMWNQHWNESDFVPKMNASHKANPLVFFQRNEFCPEDAINARLGITAGFNAYEWEKDGVVIARRENGSNTNLNPSVVTNFAAGGNEITVNSYGTYRVRFKRTASGEWSEWSPRPVVIGQKAVTQTPDIFIEGVQSNVLPAPDGRNQVTLSLPEGYYAYQWYNADNEQLIGSARTINVGIGNYKARVVEEYGCGTLFSPVFRVISANGINKPDPARTLTAIAASLTSVQLDWNENPNAGENETGFEVYRAAQPGGPYTLVHITAPDVTSFLDEGLTTNTSYYYIVRAVGNHGAAENSNEASVTTAADVTPPTAPTNLRIKAITTSYATIEWDASTDDAGVDKYDIFINGQKSYTTTGTSFTIPDLVADSNFTFIVKARDKAGNVSGPSNQVSASTKFTHNGLGYKYYEGPAWSNLPDFNTLTPVKTGIAPVPSLSAALRTTNYAFLWEGMIKIDVAARYTFEICSDDGSRLWIGTGYTHGTSRINNDGAHGNQCRTDTITLAPGMYPIALGYFQAGGGAELSFNWQHNQGMSKQAVPQSVLFTAEPSSAYAPAPASQLQATAVNHSTIELSWVDNSNGAATGFEIVRATTEAGPYQQIGTVTGTTFTDNGLTPATTYYYKVRSIGDRGESDYVSAFTGAYYTLDSTNLNSWARPNTHLIFNGTVANYWRTDQVKHGTHSVYFGGVNNQYASINGSNSGGYPNTGGYFERTIALWLKPDAIDAYNRVIFDIGNNANGIALRTNAGINGLQAGIASGSVRLTIEDTATFAKTVWQANDWNHVAVVFSYNSLRLYLNGVLVAQNDQLPFDRIAANANNFSRLGGASGTGAGETAFNQAHNSGNNSFFKGYVDEVYIIEGALSADELSVLMSNNFEPSNASTEAAPAPPAVPTGLGASIPAPNKVRLRWNDNSANEAGFEVWRSVANNTAYRLVATLPANHTDSVVYVDEDLFSNATYYYKVKAIGDINSSDFSNEVSIITPNTRPVLHKIEDLTIRYNSNYVLQVQASDSDGDALTITTTGLPAFVNVTPQSNGIVNFTMNPRSWDLGVYGIMVYVEDAMGDRDSAYFTLVVNDNTVPVFQPVGSVSIDEGQLLTIPVIVDDEDSEGGLQWKIDELPSWATFEEVSNGQGNIILLPDFASAGSHTIKLSVEDEYGAWAHMEFVVNVNDVDPNETFQISFRAYGPSQSGWNDVNVAGASTFNRTNLVNTKGETTSVGIRTTSGSFSSGGSGMDVGNGTYPANVRYDMIHWGYFNGNNNSDTLVLSVTGLQPGKKYNFVFYAGSNCNYCSLNSNSRTTYKIGDETAEVRMYMNTTQTDTIYQVSPSATGEVIITMIGDPNNAVGGNLNALVIDAAQDDGTTPLKPLNLKATAIDNGARLTWEDRAYNESAYHVYRATAKAGPYTLLNPDANNKDSVGYNDLNLAPFTNYYYYVRGVNRFGNGESSDTVLFQTLNNLPEIAGTADIMVKIDGTHSLNFTVTDDPGDVIEVTLEGAPGFVTLTHLSGSNYRITAAPSTGQIGKFEFLIVAEDDKGGRAEQPVTVTVSDKNTRSIYINIAPVGYAAPSPWNNFLGYGGALNTVNNLLDENGVNTGFSMQLVNKWENLLMNGQPTGNNSGTYPDAVLAQGWWDNNSGARQIRFSGLNDSKVYNIIVMASRTDGERSISRYSVGAVADTLDASYNSHLTANLNRLVPANGEIVMDVNRLTGTVYTIINAIQIEEMDEPIALAPNNVYAEAIDRNSVKITWSDRNHNEAAADGFQLQLATDSLFNNVLNTIDLPQNTVQYTANNLDVNKRVWARVRSKVGGVYTEWSNTARANTTLTRVLVNFNIADGNQAQPWNNLESNPTEPFVKTGLVNQDNNQSGVSIEFLTPMNGDNNFGVVTGNNSGVVPDNVLRTNYWLDKLQKSQVVVAGLNQSKTYRIGFFGSMSNNGWFYGNYTATYTINGVTVQLNSWLNDRKVVYIDQIVPNSDGEVLIEFSTIAEADWAFNGGLIIESYDVVAEAPGESNEPTSTVEKIVISGNTDAVLMKEVTEEILTGGTTVYPNPFTSQVNLAYTQMQANQQVAVNVYDINGKLLKRDQSSSRPAGKQLITLNLAGPEWKPGYYIVTLVIDGKVVYTTKIMKAN